MTLKFSVRPGKMVMDSSTAGKLLGSNPIVGPRENIRKRRAESRGFAAFATSTVSAEPSSSVFTTPMLREHATRECFGGVPSGRYLTLADNQACVTAQKNRFPRTIGADDGEVSSEASCWPPKWLRPKIAAIPKLTKTILLVSLAEGWQVVI